MAYDYQTLQIKNELGVLTATINNPPVNVMTHSLYMDLVGFTSEVEQDESVKVVVFQSADPDFFIAHFDVEAIFVVSWAVTWDRLGWAGFWQITFFIVILFLGLLYLWKKGGLDWGSRFMHSTSRRGHR